MSEEKVCPDCGENVKAAARKCRFCGYKFEEPGIWDRAVQAAATAATEKAREIEAQRAKNFQWISGKGCLISFVGIFAAVILLGAIINVIDPEGVAQRKAEREAAAQAEKTMEVAEAQAEKDKGFHCLSAWDGSNLSTKTQVKARMRNPDSFEHIETKIAPVSNGKHLLRMTYRAQNGFGGMNVATAAASVDAMSCDAVLTSLGR